MSRPPAPSSAVVLAIVGAGPSGTAVLERLCASAPELLGGQELVVHVIDPHPPGAGRVWRYDQSPLLRMNSMAEDVTMFTDESVRCEGPIRPGPSLDEWARQRARDGLRDAALTDEVRALDGMTFPTRRLQSEYLSWVFATVVRDAPSNVHVCVHPATAVSMSGEMGACQRIELDDGAFVDADVVVLTTGHLDVVPGGEHAELRDFAARHDVVYIPPGYTADLDLSAIAPGEDVIVRGLGLAFIDLVVLLGEGRGGRFVPTDDGLVYERSGAEPHLWAGSRRGVPYHAKLGYRLQGERAALPRFFDRDAVDRLLARPGMLDFRDDIWPLLAKEICWGYYHELFTGHPDRVAVPFETFAERYATVDWGSDAFDALVAEAVPAFDDRLDLDTFDRPLAGKHFETLDELQGHLLDHVVDDIDRRADPRFSADLGAFTAVLAVFPPLFGVAASGRLRVRSRAEEVDGWWFGFFSFLASGPPSHRLDELVALARAGVVSFLGSDQWIERDEQAGVFRSGSASTPASIEARVLIDAQLPRSSISRTTNALLAALRERGDGIEELLVDPVDDLDAAGEPPGAYSTERLVVAPEDLRVIGADGRPHPQRFALGASTSVRAAGAFARPRTNAISFRQTDLLARAVLSQLATAAGVDRRHLDELAG